MKKSKIVILLLIFLSIFLRLGSVNAASDIILQPIPNPVINYIYTSNFYKVDENYYRGGKPDKDDYAKFALLGIKTIINLQRADDEDFIEQERTTQNFNINYVNIPMSPGRPPTNEQIKYFFKIIDNPKNLPVYVHCWQGKDRTGIMTALYRVRNYGWNFNQAYSEMKERGYHFLFYPKQKDFLYKYTANYFSNVQKF